MADNRSEPEEWRPVVGYEGLYDVSSHGRVRSWTLRGHGTALAKTPLIKAPQPGGLKGQYRTVRLARRGEPMVTRYIHRLVARAFLGPCPDGHEAAHDDGVGDHNWSGNLAWKTKKANHADKHRHGTAQIGERGNSAKLKDAQAQYGVGSGTVRCIRRGKTWSHIT
jgi:hypothetical protein